MKRTKYKNWNASIFEMFRNDTLFRTDKLNDNCINSSDDCSRVQRFETEKSLVNGMNLLFAQSRKQWMSRGRFHPTSRELAHTQVKSHANPLPPIKKRLKKIYPEKPTPKKKKKIVKQTTFSK